MAQIIEASDWDTGISTGRLSRTLKVARWSQLNSEEFQVAVSLLRSGLGEYGGSIPKMIMPGPAAVLEEYSWNCNSKVGGMERKHWAHVKRSPGKQCPGISGWGLRGPYFPQTSRGYGTIIWIKMYTMSHRRIRAVICGFLSAAQYDTKLH